MSGVKNKEMAEVKGLKPLTNEMLKDGGVAHKGECEEKYGEEKHKKESVPAPKPTVSEPKK